MFYGQNRLYIACFDYNLLMEFSSIDSLHCTKFKEQRARMSLSDPAPGIKEGDETINLAVGFHSLPDAVKPLNKIDLMPRA